MEVTRRGFMKAAVAAGSIAAVSGLVGCSPKAQSSSTEASDAASVVAEETTSFMTPPEAIGDDAITATTEADVVVVGAGTAGLVTALTAAQEGLNVVLISASSGPVSRGGSNNAVYSKTMEEYGVPKVGLQDITNELVQASYMPDQKKWAMYYRESEECMNWLIDIMESAGYMTVLEDAAGFDEGSFYQPVSSHSWCPPDAVSAGGGQQYVVETLASELEKAGGTIRYNVVARQLVRGGQPNGTSGRVDAVIAETADGAYEKFQGSKAVVLATGDFSANGEMMEKYCSWAAPYFQDNPEVDYDITVNMGGLYRGDGHQMGLWVGAAWQKIVPNACMGGNICVGPWRQLQENFLGLLVNEKGERYMNEAATSALGGMPAILQPNHKVFALWKSDYAAFHEGKWHAFGSAYSLTPTLSNEEVIAGWDSNVENGTYVKCDTLEELASELGLPEETLDTIERYNGFCETGIDEEFMKDAAYLAPLKTGPFYGTMKDSPDAMTVLGGLRTNEHMQVCDDSDAPIDGLYNVGTMVGDLFGGIYTFQLQGANLGMSCVCFGHLTGKYIAENE